MIFRKLVTRTKDPLHFWRGVDRVLKGTTDDHAELELSSLARQFHPGLRVRVNRSHTDQPVLTFVGGDTIEGLEAALKLRNARPRQWRERTVHEHTPLQWMRLQYHGNTDYFQTPERPPLEWKPLVFYGNLALGCVSDAIVCEVVGQSALSKQWLGTADEVIETSWRYIESESGAPDRPIETVALVLAERIAGILSNDAPCNRHEFPFEHVESSIESDAMGAEIQAVALAWSLCALIDNKDIASSIAWLLRFKRDSKTAKERALARLLVRHDSPETLREPLGEALDRWLDPVGNTHTDADLHRPVLRHSLALVWCKVFLHDTTKITYIRTLLGES